jgi:twitching motility protein PilJ
MEETMRLGPGSMLPDSMLNRGDSSIISEAAPSELAAEFSETRMPATWTTWRRPRACR